MDDADRSDERIQRLIDEGIARARTASERSLRPIGVCHYCQSLVNSGRIFCSKDCSDDYEYERVRRRAQGL